jgi:predicted membrane protein
MEASERTRAIAPQLVLGLMIAVGGVLFTLENVGVVEAHAYLRFWPVALIAIGFVKLWQCGSGSGAFPGFLLLFAGAWLLLEAVGFVTISLWDLWPLVFVFAGASMIWRGIRGPGGPRGGADSHSTVNAVAVLGGVNRGNNSRAFRGGDLTAVMGGCQIDLRNAAIDGEAVIDVFAMWGGIEIKVPEDWSVSGRVTTILGGYEDKTRPPRDSTAHRLILRGVVIMGGIEVKNGYGGDASDPGPR